MTGEKRELLLAVYLVDSDEDNAMQVRISMPQRPRDADTAGGLVALIASHIAMRCESDPRVVIGAALNHLADGNVEFVSEVQ